MARAGRHPRIDGQQLARSLLTQTEGDAVGGAPAMVRPKRAVAERARRAAERP